MQEKICFTRHSCTAIIGDQRPAAKPDLVDNFIVVTSEEYNVINTGREGGLKIFYGEAKPSKGQKRRSAYSPASYLNFLPEFKGQQAHFE